MFGIGHIRQSTGQAGNAQASERHAAPQEGEGEVWDGGDQLPALSQVNLLKMGVEAAVKRLREFRKPGWQEAFRVRFATDKALLQSLEIHVSRRRGRRSEPVNTQKYYFSAVLGLCQPTPC